MRMMVVMIHLLLKAAVMRVIAAIHLFLRMSHCLLQLMVTVFEVMVHEDVLLEGVDESVDEGVEGTREVEGYQLRQWQ
jgi:hypothetical protein